MRKRTYTVLIFFLSFLSGIKSSFSQDISRNKIPIDGGWLFHKSSESDQKITLPHTWNIKDVIDDEPGYYRGEGSYSKEFRVEEAWKGKDVYVCFEGVNQETEVFINGELVGKHIGGYTQFRFLVNRYLKNKGLNKIEVKVNNRFNENIPPLSADFTFYGGIYRHVYLLATNKVHFSDEKFGAEGIFITAPIVTDSMASMTINGKVCNHDKEKRELTVTTNVLDKNGDCVAKAHQKIAISINSETDFKLKLPKIMHPKLWSPEQPYLYTVESFIEDENHHQIDFLTQKYGFRWFRFDADKGFFLNGKPYKLMGASRHQDFKGLGNALPDSIQKNDMLLLKNMGANFLRIAHYPQSPLILQACDSLGILASVEIPVVNQISETEAFSANAKFMQHEMIMQNFNHTSVIIWGYMNEVLLKLPFGDDVTRQNVYLKNVKKLATSLDSITRNEDPSRYTMMANHGSFDLYKRAGLLEIPQLIGWNLYQGWYGGKIADFAVNLDQIHQNLPHIPFLITEFGADADPRLRSLVPERFDKSVDYALEYHNAYIKAIQERDFVAGGAIWNLADFNSETREETMPHINNKGLLTWDRQKKDLYYFYKAKLGHQPFVKISNWSFRSGIAAPNKNDVTQKVAVFSNEKNITLYQNGKRISRAEIENGLVFFEVPFINGENLLSACADDDQIADTLKVHFDLFLNDLKDGLQGKTLQILLGAKRFFIGTDHQVWMPDKPYEKGNWGYTGGKAFTLPNKNRQPYGTDKNIKGTENDPLFQTQQLGLKSYKIDVPAGKYELKLYFAEFSDNENKEALVYNLDQDISKNTAEKRVFDVNINSKKVIKNFNIAAQFGSLKAVSETFWIKVKAHEGILIDFKAIEGQPILNALQLKEIK